MRSFESNFIQNFFQELFVMYALLQLRRYDQGVFFFCLSNAKLLVHVYIRPIYLKTEP